MVTWSLFRSQRHFIRQFWFVVKLAQYHGVACSITSVKRNELSTVKRGPRIDERPIDGNLSIYIGGSDERRHSYRAVVIASGFLEAEKRNPTGLMNY